MKPPFLDANIFVYTSSPDVRATRAQEILDQPWQTSIQALSEFALASHRKLKLSWPAIRERSLTFCNFAIRFIRLR